MDMIKVCLNNSCWRYITSLPYIQGRKWKYIHAEEREWVTNFTHDIIKLKKDLYMFRIFFLPLGSLIFRVAHYKVGQLLNFLIKSLFLSDKIIDFCMILKWLKYKNAPWTAKYLIAGNKYNSQQVKEIMVKFIKDELLLNT